jgi:intein/homing endonuclease
MDEVFIVKRLLVCFLAGSGIALWIIVFYEIFKSLKQWRAEKKQKELDNEWVKVMTKLGFELAVTRGGRVLTKNRGWIKEEDLSEDDELDGIL